MCQEIFAVLFDISVKKKRQKHAAKNCPLSGLGWYGG
jgi:hypothetical protein